MRDIRVATVQFEHAPGDKAYNLGRVRHFADAGGARTRRDPRLSRDVHHRLLARAQAHARGVRAAGRARARRAVRAGAAAALGRAQDDASAPASWSAATTGASTTATSSPCPTGRWAVHRKLHVFEHPHISAGDRYTVFDTPHGCRVGMLICYDNNIVENARITALLGAEMLLAPHQTGGCSSVSPRGMKPIDRAVWDRRRRGPGGVRGGVAGRRGAAG